MARNSAFGARRSAATAGLKSWKFTKTGEEGRGIAHRPKLRQQHEVRLQVPKKSFVLVGTKTSSVLHIGIYLSAAIVVDNPR